MADETVDIFDGTSFVWLFNIDDISKGSDAFDPTLRDLP